MSDGQIKKSRKRLKSCLCLHLQMITSTNELLPILGFLWSLSQKDGLVRLQEKCWKIFWKWKVSEVEAKSATGELEMNQIVGLTLPISWASFKGPSCKAGNLQWDHWMPSAESSDWRELLSSREWRSWWSWVGRWWQPVQSSWKQQPVPTIQGQKYLTLEMEHWSSAVDPSPACSSARCRTEWTCSWRCWWWWW